MGRLLLRAGELALLLILSPPFSGQVLELTGQETDIKTAKKTQEEAIKGSNLMKPHFANGNRAMQDAQAIRQQLLQQHVGLERLRLQRAAPRLDTRFHKAKPRRRDYDVEWVPERAAQRSYSALAFSASPRWR